MLQPSIYFDETLNLIVEGSEIIKVIPAKMIRSLYIEHSITLNDELELVERNKKTRPKDKFF